MSQAENSQWPCWQAGDHNTLPPFPIEIFIKSLPPSPNKHIYHCHWPSLIIIPFDRRRGQGQDKEGEEENENLSLDDGGGLQAKPPSQAEKKGIFAYTYMCTASPGPGLSGQTVTKQERDPLCLPALHTAEQTPLAWHFPSLYVFLHTEEETPYPTSALGDPVAGMPVTCPPAFLPINWAACFSLYAFPDLLIYFLWRAYPTDSGGVLVTRRETGTSCSGSERREGSLRPSLGGHLCRALSLSLRTVTFRSGKGMAWCFCASCHTHTHTLEISNSLTLLHLSLPQGQCLMALFLYCL